MHLKTSSEVRSEKWKELLRAQAETGESIVAFCIGHQINRSTFYSWKQKLRSLAKSSSSRFIPISTKSLSFQNTSVSKTARLFLPNGVQIDLGESLESAAVYQLIQTLCGGTHAKS